MCLLKNILKSSIACLAFSTTLALAAGTPYVGVSTGELTNTSSSLSRNYRGLPLAFNLGYGALLSENLYLGAELLGTVGSAAFNDNGLKSTYGFGLGLIPGLLLGDHTMTYLRLGITRSHFTPAGANNHNVSGGQFGLGLQLGLTQNLELRGEYDFTAYQSFSSISSPRQDAFNLGLIYKFDS